VSDSLWFIHTHSLTHLCLARCSPDGENFIKVKIFNARNLHTLDGSYKSAINPSVSVEWAGLIRETSIKMDTVMPKYDEVLDFRVSSVDNEIPTTMIVQVRRSGGWMGKPQTHVLCCLLFGLFFFGLLFLFRHLFRLVPCRTQMRVCVLVGLTVF
jgi:hypothetical protein